MTLRSTIATFFAALLLFPPGSIAAPTTTASSQTLRTANYFLRAGSELDASVATLAAYDLVVLPAEAEVLNRAALLRLRELNPSIILLAYVPTVSWNSVWHDALHDELATRIVSDDWLTTHGSPMTIWPGTTALDLPGNWNTTLASYVANDILGTGLWSGVFYDEVSDDIWWDAARTDAWHAAYAKLFTETRRLAPHGAVILTNGSSRYEAATDGRMFEAFPTPWESDGDWTAQVETILASQDTAVINVTTNNTGILDPANVRLGLAAALITGSFLSVDYGTTSHGQLWHAPDFDGDIGSPTQHLIRSASGLFVQTFTSGIVIANPTGIAQTWNDNGAAYTVSAHDAVIIDENIAARLY